MIQIRASEEFFLWSENLMDPRQYNFCDNVKSYHFYYVSIYHGTF